MCALKLCRTWADAGLPTQLAACRVCDLRVCVACRVCDLRVCVACRVCDLRVCGCDLRVCGCAMVSHQVKRMGCRSATAAWWCEKTCRVMRQALPVASSRVRRQGPKAHRSAVTSRGRITHSSSKHEAAAVGARPTTVTVTAATVMAARRRRSAASVTLESQLFVCSSWAGYFYVAKYVAVGK